MLGGQCVDVESEGKNLERERLDFIYRLKTSALIEASMMVGAVLAGASDEKIALLERVAGKVGLAFQIQDDILDVVSTTEAAGQTGGQRRREPQDHLCDPGRNRESPGRRETSCPMKPLRSLTRWKRKIRFWMELLKSLIDRKK